MVIAGAGPTGLMLACELRLAGADVVVVDRLAERTGESRAGGIHSRTLEVLDQRGILDRFLAAGRPSRRPLLRPLPGLRRVGVAHPYPLLILQSAIERLLEEWAGELGVRVRRRPRSRLRAGPGRRDGRVTGTRHGPDAARRATWSAATAARSTVRKLAGIDFPGTAATMTALIGDVELADPGRGPRLGAPLRGRRLLGVRLRAGLVPGDHVDDTTASRGRDEATFERAPGVPDQGRGHRLRHAQPRWVSRFNDAARQAAEYRQGRVLLAGDAAHIHFPAGGQGLNMGVQDAVNLGWKLASVVRGRAPESSAGQLPRRARLPHCKCSSSRATTPGAGVYRCAALLLGLRQLLRSGSVCSSEMQASVMLCP